MCPLALLVLLAGPAADAQPSPTSPATPPVVALRLAPPRYDLEAARPLLQPLVHLPRVGPRLPDASPLVPFALGDDIPVAGPTEVLVRDPALAGPAPGFYDSAWQPVDPQWGVGVATSAAFLALLGAP